MSESTEKVRVRPCLGLSSSSWDLVAPLNHFQDRARHGICRLPDFPGYTDVCIPGLSVTETWGHAEALTETNGVDGDGVGYQQPQGHLHSNSLYTSMESLNKDKRVELLITELKSEHQRS